MSGTAASAYWPGDCSFTSPYLTAYLLHVFKTAADLKYQVDAGMRARAYAYLERELAAEPPTNEGWWPSYTAWQAFAVKVLVEGGRNQDSNLTRLYGYRERMPVFGLAYLHDAYVARAAQGGAALTRPASIADLRRRMANAILPEAGSAHVEELSDPYLLWFWNSNVRTTSIVLNSLVKANVSDAPVRQMVRWMMAARKDGRWGNTQENALAMEALVAYYRKFESAPPDFRAVVKLGTEDFAREEFKGRTTTSKTKELPMTKVLAQGAGRNGAAADVHARGDRARSSTPPACATRRTSSSTKGLDNGIRIARSYAPYRRDRHAAGGDHLQGRRSRPRDVDVRPDEGAPLRGRHRSASGRVRGRGVVVRHDRGVAGARAGRSGRSQARAGSRGGSAAASITSNATTTASSSSPRASAKAATSSPTSSAPRPPARSAPRRRAPKRCTRPRSSGGRRRR